MTFKARITTAIATGAVLLNALAPVAMAETIKVTGNGAFSNNTVNLNTNNTTNVNQTNTANITNIVKSDASTGGNSTSFNTGGESKIVTGNATANVDLSTAVNLNKADLPNCGTCEGDDLNIKISGNGAGFIEGSDNTVNVTKNNTVNLSQNNDANIRNDVDAKANTGDNDSSFNTGGDSIILTGKAITDVSVDNKANANIAKIGGNGGNGEGGSSLKIIGNGAFSDNNIDLNLDSAIILDQYNNADITNIVDAKANTGKNDAKFNTGGITAIVTGKAKTNVDVDNLANFNSAKIDCDCVLEDLKVKIDENGAKSDSEVALDVEEELALGQNNDTGLLNDVDGKAKTGYNDVDFSTGDVDGDPFIKTGESKSNTDVSNAGNVNLFNEGSSLHIPGNWEVNAYFDLEDLLSFLHLG